MAMEECPKCRNESVAYDSYHGVKMCLIDGCTVRIIDEKHYSVLRYNSKTDSMDRVEIEKGGETIINPKVLRSYNLS